MNDILKGFSKLSREEKTRCILDAFSSDPQQATRTLHNYLHADPALETLHEGFAENTLANYYLPFCIAPNFRINGRMYAVPMVIEESSVVAALSKSAAFWAERGGFSARTLSAVKKGQIHLLYTEGKPETLSEFFLRIRPQLLEATEPLTEKMRARGGGITSLELKDCTDRMDGYYQIDLSADTRDSMGANFINSVLEAIASRFKALAEEHSLPGRLEILMSILSNYTPDCRTEAVLECPVEEMAIDGFSGEDFCRRFVAAVHIASLSVSRAVTHNKGIMNGVDGVILATGNDFRAVEACAHAYAARSGRYASLTQARIEDGRFRFSIDLPIAVGTVGGLTRLHPLSAVAMDILGHPSAEELMQVAACVGLAQNFSAVRALITSGIQRGHMKMHLGNILRSLGATAEQMHAAEAYFAERTVSHRAVEDFLKNPPKSDQ